MKKLAIALAVTLSILSSQALAVYYSTSPPTDKKNYPIISFGSASVLKTLTFEADAIAYQLIARNGTVNWHEKSWMISKEAGYITIKQDIADWNHVPLYIKKNTTWYFSASAAGVSLEAQVWYF
jgi:hypothetical protein